MATCGPIALNSLEAVANHNPHTPCSYLARNSSLPESRASALSRRRIGLAIGVFVAVVGGVVFADYWSARPVGIHPSYVGRGSCIDCHREQADAFVDSHHDRAMDLATPDTVLADFDDATLEHDGITSRMYRDGDRFMVRTEGENGQLQDFEVKYVFGVEPLQQYMVEFDRPDDLPADQISRLQVLRLSWDTERERWFYLRPPDVADKLEPDDPLHWTGIGQRWQTMCADCHSTNLQTGYDPQTARYHTTFSEIDVSCEACHGPGSLHVELAQSKSLFWDRRYGYGLARLKGDDPEPELQTCAPCHSRRSRLTSEFLPGDEFCDHFNLGMLQDSTYFADGQIKDEVYVYGSFLQSRMYHQGVRCTDCHDPHSLQLKHSGNDLCTSCHQHSAGKYDVPSHHHHTPGSAGSMCVNCHMPHRTYMDVDPRRDHSLRVPRPDLSVRLGTPNACSGCHVADRLDLIEPEKRQALLQYSDWQAAAEQGDPEVRSAIEATDRWCDEACRQWYGEKTNLPYHFSESVVAYRREEPGAEQKLLEMATASDTRAPAIARASAINELAERGSEAVVSIARGLAENSAEHSLVRSRAVNAMMNSRNARQIRRVLMPLLKDPARDVRTEAARVIVASGVYRTLSGTEQTRVDFALEEVHDALMVAADRSGAHLSWAMMCEGRGRIQEAVQAYETAIRVEPNTTGPRTNLAALLEQLAAQSPGAGGSQMLQRAGQLRAAELPLLGRDAKLAPDNASIQYRYGLALYLANRMDEAMQRLERAVELEPDVPDFRTARDLLKDKLRQAE